MRVNQGYANLLLPNGFTSIAGAMLPIGKLADGCMTW